MALRAGRLLVSVNQKKEYASAGGGREEKRGDIHPPFSLILSIKVIQSKWLKRDRSLIFPDGKGEEKKPNQTCLSYKHFNNNLEYISHFSIPY